MESLDGPRGPRAPARPLGRLDYSRRSQMEAQRKSEVDFTCTRRSAGIWILTVVLLPLGLIFFFAFKQTSSVTVLLEKEAGGTRITVSGQAKPRVIEGIDHRLSNDFGSDAEV